MTTHRSGGTGAQAEAGFDIKSNLREVLDDLKKFDPVLAKEVRKRLVASGNAAIAAMGAILDEDAGGVVTSKTHRLGTDRRGRGHLVVDKVNTRAANRSRSTGARQEIKRGLKLKVTTGKNRTSIRLTTTSGALRKAMNKKSWRHPVFNDPDTWIEQPGSQYFNRGFYSEAKNLRNAMEDAVQTALDAVAAHKTTTLE
ncbi:MAG TPA: hypothetical protein VMV41_08710 [Cellulomonadaceae bacterium]|nr:hypothetical protein [Cellulomonadaceae bacterium]